MKLESNDLQQFTQILKEASELAKKRLFVWTKHESNVFEKLSSLNNIEMIPHLAPFPVLLLRANDGVKQISYSAMMKLQQLLKHQVSYSLIPFLTLIARLYGKQRYNHSVLITAIEDHLIQSDFQALLDCILSAKIPINRIALSIAAKNKTAILKVIAVSLKSQDVLIKLEILRLIKNIAEESQREVLCQLLRDKSSIIRKHALYYTVTSFPSDDIMNTFLFDKSRSIREVARYYSGHSSQELVNIYRDALNNKKESLPIAVMGLAEVGSEQDFKLIEPYLTHDNLKLKMVSVYALLKLRPLNKQELLLNQLLADHPGVTRLVYQELIKDSSGFNLKDLKDAFCQHGDQARYLFIKLEVAAITDRWEKLDFLINHFLQESNLKIRNYLLRSIERWIVTNSPNKVFTKANKNIVNDLLPKIDQLIAEDIETELFGSLKKNIGYFL